MFIVLTFFCFGWWRGSFFYHHVQIYDQLAGQNVDLVATAIEDGYYGNNGQLMFKADDVSVDSDKIPGQIVIAGRGVNAIYSGDQVEVKGKLYRKRGLSQAGVSFAQIEKISSGNSPIDSLRRNFEAGLQNVLPDQLASFGLGLLIGQRNTLDEKVNEDLISVGLIHIVAVSGYNLTVIINQVKNKFGKSRFQTLVFSLGFIFVFLMFTAGEPSIVRAALVSTISMLAWYYGRTIKPLVLLLFVAALTAGLNPLYLWSSIGWYLSFSAFFGVLILSPAIINRFFYKFKDSAIVQLTSETTAAQICTLPIILYIFGRLSTVSIISNVLTGAFVPAAMLATFIAGVVGMFKVPLAGIIALPARLIMEYILGVSALLAKLSWASIDLTFTLPMMIGFIVAIIFFTRVIVKKQKENVII